ncbi:protein AATF-like [Trichogramma pretiosum]|uniref:protein AATF-like n=1 Tax=Trichogramma pretiosum TaxID=7493 RepID=UPI0006C9C202|nr:protein AATF-like [Trichogramma pretiosum]
MSKPKKNVGSMLKNLWDPTPNLTFSDDEAEETKAKVADFDEELELPDDYKTGPSSSKLRKRNADLLGDIDRRYRGKKVSSKQIFQQSSDESSGKDDDNDDDGSIDLSNDEGDGSIVSGDEDNENDGGDDDDQSDSSSENIQQESDDDNDSSGNKEFAEGSYDENSDENSDENEDDDELDESRDYSNPLLRERKKDIVLVKPSDLREEIYKGNCIKEQLNIWENILQMRILAQKVLNTSNKMPQHDVYPTFASNEEFKKKSEETKSKLRAVLNNLLSLQTELLNNFPETKNLLSGKRKANDEDNNDEDDEEIPSDFEGEEIESEDHSEEEISEEKSEKKTDKQPPKKKMKLSDYEKVLAKNHKLLKEYREPIIQKLNDKTRVATGVISKDRKLSVVEKIDFAFSNRDKLVKKTQLKRSDYEIIGKSSPTVEDNDGRRTEEYDAEIFDDYDFYHSLLRDFINSKLSDTTDPNQLTQKWIELDKMRSKMKRKIDTKATKGRRLRYNVHQKLVNWMAPIPDNMWTDNGKDELFSSLFKK